MARLSRLALLETIRANLSRKPQTAWDLGQVEHGTSLDFDAQDICAHLCREGIASDLGWREQPNGTYIKRYIVKVQRVSTCCSANLQRIGSRLSCLRCRRHCSYQEISS